MSTLLEQAIVDAEALKEAAIKNAEAAIIEKYSSEVKDAVHFGLIRVRSLSWREHLPHGKLCESNASQHPITIRV